MIVMRDRFYVWGILLLAAIFSSWLLWQYVLNSSWEAPANPRNPDAFVNQLDIVIMNTEGKPEYQFSSPHLLHYAENDRTTFVSPHALLYQDNAPPWIVDAISGEALNGHTQVMLQGNVTMSQAAGKNNPNALIKTEKAIIYPKEHLVTTDQFISATEPKALAEGTGMRLNLKQRTLDLLSDVRGTYAPATR